MLLIKADKSKLAFKATDLDLEVTETIAAEVGPGGATTVPAHMFYEIVRKLPRAGQIVLESLGRPGRCWQSAPDAPALPCRRCPRATSPTLRPAR